MYGLSLGPLQNSGEDGPAVLVKRCKERFFGCFWLRPGSYTDRLIGFLADDCVKG